MTTIVIVGQAEGIYENSAVSKEFKGKVLLTTRPDGAVIIHNLEHGVRPICYIDEGAQVAVSKDGITNEIDIYATTEDGQKLTVKFTEVLAMQGIPQEKPAQSMAMQVLKCVFDMEGTYGRTTIARVLAGSVSKRVLTIDIKKLKTYGTCKGSNRKEILSLIDWLIEENYIAYAEDSEFPVIVITKKGLDVLAGGDELPVEKTEATIKEYKPTEPTTAGR
jgi:hypothetical protein